jgi:DNA-binding NarL/FixJ family response regulator
VAAVARTNREPMHRTELTSEIASRILKDLERAPLVPEAMIDRVSASDLSLSDGLSKREIQVLELLSHGTTVAQAADSLGISFETARNHKKAARFKLRAKNTTHAGATALRKGLIR